MRKVEIEMDKMRNLKFGINALIDMEKQLGRPLAELGDNAGLGDFRVMLYCGLKHEDKKLTIEQAGDLMDECIDKHNMEYLSEKIGEAMTKAMGNSKLPSNV